MQFLYFYGHVQGRYTVPWSGNYSLLLEGGAKFDFVAAGMVE